MWQSKWCQLDLLLQFCFCPVYLFQMCLEKKVLLSKLSGVVLLGYMSSGKIMNHTFLQTRRIFTEVIFLALYVNLANEMLSKTDIRFIVVLSSMSFRKDSNLNGSHIILVKFVFLIFYLILSFFLYMDQLIASIFVSFQGASYSQKSRN